MPPARIETIRNLKKTKHEKRDLKIQASFCIIYLERLSDALSDCPQLNTKLKEIKHLYFGRLGCLFLFDMIVYK